MHGEDDGAQQNEKQTLFFCKVKEIIIRHYSFAPAVELQRLRHPTFNICKKKSSKDDYFFFFLLL
jgi:hypothetical protein